MPSPIVSLERVEKHYLSFWGRRSKTALAGIDLEIFDGESMGFIGHNGAGKSTAIRLILGLQRPSGGRVRLNGLSPDNPESRRRVAYLPENPLLYDYLTPLELLTMGARIHGVPAVGLHRHCMAWLERFGVAEVANRPIRSFSKGMTQRTALAHALAVDPEFLILDEPLSGLDPIGRRDVVEILDEFRQAGRTLFFSSHVLFDVERLADRFTFIHGGRIAAIGSPDELLSAESEGFEVTVESDMPPAGFVPVSSRLSRMTVPKSALTDVLSKINADNSDVSLHSVKNMNSLEKAYLKFVRIASEENA